MDKNCVLALESRAMNHEVKGPFDVKLSPEPPYDTVDGVSLGRITIQKKFHGDLEASGSAQMLSAGTPVQGSAGYVAIERVTGSLKGRTGTFVLQHSGTMDRGKPSLALAIVPDSGTGELKGLAGTMKIDIVDGKHFYTLNYTLNDA